MIILSPITGLSQKRWCAVAHAHTVSVQCTSDSVGQDGHAVPNTGDLEMIGRLTRQWTSCKLSPFLLLEAIIRLSQIHSAGLEF